jgi:hypothetical protein
MSTPIYDQVAYATRLSDTRKDPVLDKAFLAAERFVTTNVTEYFFAGTDQEFWHFGKHFPNLAPVFDSFWIETKRPTHIRSEIHGMQAWENLDTDFYRRPYRWGAWFVNVNTAITDASMQRTWENSLLTRQSYPNIDPNEHWWYAATVWVQYHEHEQPAPLWTFGFIVNKTTGQIVRNAQGTPLFDPYFFRSDPMPTVREAIDALDAACGHRTLDMRDPETNDVKSANVQQIWESEAVTLLKPLLLALSFLHCKNVERMPQPVAPKLNKKRVSRGLPPMHKHYTLNIVPMQRIIQQALDVYRGKKTDIEIALHRVRGHFKTYGPDAPLLGHHIGTWFWADAARGSARKGTRTKDYAVKAPHAG